MDSKFHAYKLQYFSEALSDRPQKKRLWKLVLTLLFFLIKLFINLVLKKILITSGFKKKVLNKVKAKNLIHPVYKNYFLNTYDLNIS